MRVAVVDDEQEVRSNLVEYLNCFSKESGVKIETSSFSSGDELLKSYQQIWDILIFDIDMPGTNGMETAKQIRRKDKNVTILFITNIAQYAIEGYEVDAVDYILKPINYYEFSMKFYRAVSKSAYNRERMILVESVEGTRRIRVKEIVYVEVLAHYIFIHTEKRQFKARGNMKSWEEQLKSFGFSRIHKSYLVNMAKVETISGKVLVANGKTIPISRNYRDSFMQDYMKYYGGT